MTKKLGVHKCGVCGNIVEVLDTGAGELFCCGEQMTLLKEQTADSASEKHVPYIEKIDGGYKVSVGQNAAHPMEEKHYIQWIELICGDMVTRAFLKPGDKPEASFCMGDCYEECGPPTARELCNVHGLWKGE